MKYVYSEIKDGYHAKVAFSRLTTKSVGYSILECIYHNPGISQKQCNCHTAPEYRRYSGYRSSIYARLVKDGALKLGKGNRGYFITSYGRDLIREACLRAIDED